MSRHFLSIPRRRCGDVELRPTHHDHNFDDPVLNEMWDVDLDEFKKQLKILECIPETNEKLRAFAKLRHIYVTMKAVVDRLDLKDIQPKLHENLVEATKEWNVPLSDDIPLSCEGVQKMNKEIDTVTNNNHCTGTVAYKILTRPDPAHPSTGAEYRIAQQQLKREKEKRLAAEKKAAREAKIVDEVLKDDKEHKKQLKYERRIKAELERELDLSLQQKKEMQDGIDLKLSRARSAVEVLKNRRIAELEKENKGLKKHVAMLEERFGDGGRVQYDQRSWNKQPAPSAEQSARTEMQQAVPVAQNVQPGPLGELVAMNQAAANRRRKAVAKRFKQQSKAASSTEVHPQPKTEKKLTKAQLSKKKTREKQEEAAQKAGKKGSKKKKK